MGASPRGSWSQLDTGTDAGRTGKAPHRRAKDCPLAAYLPKGGGEGSTSAPTRQSRRNYLLVSVRRPNLAFQQRISASVTRATISTGATVDRVVTYATAYVVTTDTTQEGVVARIRPGWRTLIGMRSLRITFNLCPKSPAPPAEPRALKGRCSEGFLCMSSRTPGGCEDVLDSLEVSASSTLAASDVVSIGDGSGAPRRAAAWQRAADRLRQPSRGVGGLA